MWIMTNQAFLSIVDPDAPYGGGMGPQGDKLLVRARIEGDIERVFPGAAVKRTPERDYLFRAMIPREQVAAVIAKEVGDIGYSNFKGSVQENDRHDAYASVWGVMFRLQKALAGRRRAR